MRRCFPDLYMNEYWTDPGLAYNMLNPCQGNLSFDYNVLARMWTPNTCFINSKVHEYRHQRIKLFQAAVMHSSPFRNVFLMVFPNGEYRLLEKQYKPKTSNSNSDLHSIVLLNRFQFKDQKFQ